MALLYFTKQNILYSYCTRYSKVPDPFTKHFQLETHIRSTDVPITL